MQRSNGAGAIESIEPIEEAIIYQQYTCCHHHFVMYFAHAMFSHDQFEIASHPQTFYEQLPERRGERRVRKVGSEMKRKKER